MFSQQENPHTSVIVSPETPLLEVVKRLAGSHADCDAIVQSNGESLGYFNAKTLVKIVAEGRCLETTDVSEVMIPLPQVNLANTMTHFPGEWVQSLQQSFRKSYENQRKETLITTIAARLRESYNSEAQIDAAQAELESYRNATAQLQEKEILYQYIAEMAGEGIWILDHNDATSFVNPRMAEMLGCLREEMLGLSIFDFMDAAGYAVFTEALQQRRQGLKGQYELKLISKQGMDIWTQVAATSIIGFDGQYQGMLALITDISERKQMEENLAQLNQQLERRVEARTQEILEFQGELQEKEEFLRSIYEGAEAPIWVVDVLEDDSFCLGGLNPKFESLLGYKAAEVIGKHLTVVFGHEQGQEICTFLTRCLDKGIPIIYDEHRMFQGVSYWLSTTATPLKDSLGRIHRLIVYSINITTRKEFELLQQKHVQELSEWQVRYETAGEASGQILYEYDTQKMSPIWGANTAKILGYTSAEMPDSLSSWISLIHPDDRNLFYAQSKRHIFFEKKTSHLEYRFLHKQGDYIWLEDKNQLLSNPVGKHSRIIGFINDISDRKASEAALAESEAQYRRFVENINDLVFCMNSEGFTYLSPFFKGLTGYEPTDFLGRTPLEFTYPEDIPIIGKNIQTVLTQGISINMESRIYRKDGSLRWLDVHCVPICDDQDNIVGLHGTVYDISDRKEAELKMQVLYEKLSLKNEELAHAMQMKDEFLASMSHELRTPLNAILGNSEILLDELLGSINERQRKAVNSIERSGQHLLSLINDILDLAKIGSGQIELQLAPIPIQNLCDSCIGFIQPLAQKKQIQLEIHLSIPDLAMLQGDERRLRQVLINLLSNAIKFTPDGGNVTLDVQSNVELKIIQFSVKDTGVGIAPENLQKLFQAFVQVDSSLNRRHEGTGLGLAIVKKIVELHNGTVSVESTIGQGSCFTVSFPWS
jgi:PAS domain S-box-containing protein